MYHSSCHILEWNVEGFKQLCRLNFTSHSETVSLLSFPYKDGSPDLISSTDDWGDNTEGQSLFFSQQPLAFTMTQVESTHWHADTIGMVLSIKPGGNQPRLFMLLLFIWLRTKQSLHSSETRLSERSAYSAALSSSCHSLCLSTDCFLLCQSSICPSFLFLHRSLLILKLWFPNSFLSSLMSYPHMSKFPFSLSANRNRYSGSKPDRNTQS